MACLITLSKIGEMTWCYRKCQKREVWRCLGQTKYDQKFVCSDSHGIIWKEVKKSSKIRQS